jgi:predicted nicotinamide N-methyase
MSQSLLYGFSTELRHFSLGGRQISLRTVIDPDALLDGAISSIPYWAQLWPSALALSSYLATRSFRGAQVLELGCGMGLTTLAIACAGGVPISLDYEADAVRFARHNLSANGAQGLVLRADWNALPLGCCFPYVVGADILYERRELPRVAALLNRYLARGGEAVIAEPGRELARSFFQNLEQRGLDVLQVSPKNADGVRLWRLGRKTPLR